MVWMCVHALMLCSGLNCYPTGAPDTACENMLPLHAAVPPENDPTDPAAPFAFTVSQSSFDPGVNITGWWQREKHCHE